MRTDIHRSSCRPNKLFRRCKAIRNRRFRICIRFCKMCIHRSRLKTHCSWKSFDAEYKMTLRRRNIRALRNLSIRCRRLRQKFRRRKAYTPNRQDIFPPDKILLCRLFRFPQNRCCRHKHNLHLRRLKLRCCRSSAYGRWWWLCNTSCRSPNSRLQNKS